MSEIARLNEAIQLAPRVPLGELIVQCDERNSDGHLSVSDVRGLSTQKQMIDTKANLDGVSLLPYKLVRPNQFAYVADTSRRGDKISLGFNLSDKIYLVSSISIVFNVIDRSRLLPMFLYLYFCRPEFDRYARFNSWGSAREAFSFDDMCRVRFPLPPIEVQQQYVDAYSGLRQLAEENEALYDPLYSLISNSIQKCIDQKTGSWVNLGELISKKDIRNTDSVISNVKGLTVYKSFIETKANMDGVPLHNYKVVDVNDIAYVPTTNRNGDRIACGLSEETCIVSSTYEVVAIKKNLVDPHYLFFWFKRSEMDRYARYNSWGSARETITYEDLCRYRVFLPPMDVQLSIVALQKCANEALKIAAEAKELLRTICPAMIQRASHEMH